MALTNDIQTQQFTRKVLRAFAEITEYRVLKKGEFLLQAGDIERHLYLIEEGAVKVFFGMEEEERIIRLGYNGSMLNSISSFLSGRPSEFFIEAIKQTRVKLLPQDSLKHLIHESQESLAQYNSFLETLLISQIDREMDLLIPSPARRLERVLKRSPHVFQYVPLKYIASYLRMNPETLSRIRKS